MADANAYKVGDERATYYHRSKNLAKALYNDCKEAEANFAQPEVSLQFLKGFYLELVEFDVQWTVIRQVPNMASYVNAQVQDPTYDPVAAFTQLDSRVTALGTWITQNFPKADGKLQYETMTASGVVSDVWPSSNLASGPVTGTSVHPLLTDVINSVDFSDE